jgi:hypothetical protein
MNDAIKKDKTGFREYLISLGDNAVKRHHTFGLERAVEAGKCASEIVAAGWFFDHFPASFAQTEMEAIRAEKSADSYKRHSPGIFEVEMYRADFLRKLFIIQEEMIKNALENNNLEKL